MSSPEALANVLTCVGADLAGWDKTERMVMERSYRSMRDVGLTAAQTGGPPDMSQSFTPLLEGMAHHAPVSSVMLPAMLRTYDSEWRIRTQLNLAVTALAVDRYRLANGRLPERLEELVPAFLDRVATDPWNGGKPLSYRVKENGKFLVYSLGQNGTDEKGEEVRDWWLHGDITFTVAPPEIRNRPQVADTPVAAGVGT